MEFRNLAVEKRGGLAIVRMNRPQALNALNRETILELEQALQDVNGDAAVRVVILTGEGKAFVAGADIAEMKDMQPVQAREFARLGQRVLNYLESMEKPVIAAVNGFAFGGGCELALACDIRVASANAKLGQPELKLGVIPGFAGTQRLSRLIGVARAKEMIFTGDPVDAQTALSFGLVNKVTAPEELLSTCEAMAQKMIAMGPTALRLAKTVVNRGLDSNFATGSSYEMEAFGMSFSTGEPKEGMSAFLEKRPPKWS
jgi:enoyl-CoA hydratase